MASGYLIKNKEGKTLYYDPATKKARNFNIPKGAKFKTAAKPAAAKKAAASKGKPGESAMARKEAARPKNAAKSGTTKPRTWRDGPKQGVVNKSGSLVIVQAAPKGGFNARVATGNPFSANKKMKLYSGPKR